jgi:lipoprotein-releasing system permease protein
LASQQPSSFSGFIVRLATAATAVSVATMIITISLINGFQYEVANKVYSFWGHIRVQALQPYRTMVAEETPIAASDSLEKIIAAQPGVGHVQAFAARSVVLRSTGQFDGVLMKGIDRRLATSDFSRFITQGSMLQFPDSGYSSQLIISEAMARTLEVKVGDTVSTIFLRNGDDIRSRKQIICGLYSTGIEEYDQQFVLADVRFLQRLNLWAPNQIGGYEVWLQDPANAPLIEKPFTQALPQGIMASPVADIYPNIFDWLGIQNQTKKIVISIMLAVAIINLITCLLILVMERTKMVALLAAMGMPLQEQHIIFWHYAARIAGKGIAIGLLLSLSLLLLQQYTGLIKMDEKTYYVSTVPVRIIWWQVLAVVVGTFVICLAALRLPLGYLQRISIIKALRFN